MHFQAIRADGIDGGLVYTCTIPYAVKRGDIAYIKHYSQRDGTGSKEFLIVGLRKISLHSLKIERALHVKSIDLHEEHTEQGVIITHPKYMTKLIGTHTGLLTFAQTNNPEAELMQLWTEEFFERVEQQ